MAFVQVDRENGMPVELYCEDYGAGTPVVLIHGWPLSGRSWEPQIWALVEAGHRVITYDRRGFGKSSQPWTGYDYATLAADLDTLLQHLDVEGATLVGFSMGGGEVARYLARYGSRRVAKAVLAAAVTPFLHKTEGNPDGGLDDATIEDFEQSVEGDRIQFLDDFTRLFFAPANGEALVSEPRRLYYRDIAAFASPKGTLDCIKAFALTDFRADLEQIDVPTLIIHGDADQIVPFEVSGKRSHAMVADSRLALIDGAPHGCNATHSKQFNRALLDFLEL